jgi:hypothetical protein
MELFIRSVDMLALQQAASIALLRKPHLQFLLFRSCSLINIVWILQLIFPKQQSYRRPFGDSMTRHFLKFSVIHIRTHHLGWAGSAIIPFTVPHYARCNSVCGELMLLNSRASVASLRVTCCQASSSLSLLCQFKIILFGSTFGPVPALSSL